MPLLVCLPREGEDPSLTFGLLSRTEGVVFRLLSSISRYLSACVSVSVFIEGVWWLHGKKERLGSLFSPRLPRTTVGDGRGCVPLSAFEFYFFVSGFFVCSRSRRG